MKLSDLPKLRAKRLRNGGGSNRGNKRVEIDGHKFQSIAESRRYEQLRLLQMAGKIHGLELQPHLDLFVEGVKVTRYTPDFQYWKGSASVCIFEDVKGKLEEAAWVRIRLARALGYKIELLTKETNRGLFR